MTRMMILLTVAFPLIIVCQGKTVPRPEPNTHHQAMDVPKAPHPMLKFDSPVLRRVFPDRSIYRVHVRNPRVVIAGPSHFQHTVIQGGPFDVWISKDFQATRAITAMKHRINEVNEALDLVLAFIQLRRHFLRLRGPHDTNGHPIDYTMRFERPDDQSWRLTCVLIAEPAFYRYEFTVSKEGELTARRGKLLMMAQLYL